MIFKSMYLRKNIFLEDPSGGVGGSGAQTRLIEIMSWWIARDTCLRFSLPSTRLCELCTGHSNCTVYSRAELYCVLASSFPALHTCQHMLIAFPNQPICCYTSLGGDGTSVDDDALSSGSTEPPLPMPQPKDEPPVPVPQPKADACVVALRLRFTGGAT